MKLSIYFFSTDDSIPGEERYEFLFTVAEHADRAGYHALWTPERHFQEFGSSYPNPAVLSAALSRVTRRIALRAGCVVLPHHHPARLVEDWSLVDQLSGGRAGVCLATGWHKGDFVFYPEHYQDRRQYTFDQVRTLRDLWRGESVTFPGPQGETLTVRTFPRPLQREMPLWVVHSTNPDTWVTAGTLGLNVLTLLDGWDRLEQNIQAYRAAREESGHDPQAGVVTVGLHTFVGLDDEAVRALVREPLTGYLSSFLRQRDGDAAVHGESKLLSEEEQQLLVDSAFEDMVENRALLGTPQRCVAMIERAGSIGVNEVACLLDFGLPFTTVLEGLPLLDEVLAEVSDTDDTPGFIQQGLAAGAMGYYATRRR
ncbi:LLM class flavin-dependent oxidoreductase [Actinomyces sp. 2119]|uniref:MupA/Atu3671 family FMN-dependent luciferase-like monooxygenase n=1 Tax=Actinomyces sp. 2119 TaxID=2321393 RepID=UPI000E6CA19F|nr:MupA/Atu3671 family FMN-dependent luciferase-like monooxygenase [Actinomyces sp. 2119]RJF41178.1 LLM class flavin-dependent oxidoreductase [Actinomyces sp. 2119]